MVTPLTAKDLEGKVADAINNDQLYVFRVQADQDGNGDVTTGEASSYVKVRDFGGGALYGNEQYYAMRSAQSYLKHNNLVTDDFAKSHYVQAFNRLSMQNAEAFRTEAYYTTKSGERVTILPHIDKDNMVFVYNIDTKETRMISRSDFLTTPDGKLAKNLPLGTTQSSYDADVAAGHTPVAQSPAASHAPAGAIYTGAKDLTDALTAFSHASVNTTHALKGLVGKL